MSVPAQIGRYTLGERIGEGGMGTVFQAACAEGEGPSRCAVKLLMTATLADEEGQRRFLQECKTLGALRHPHVLELYDYGVVGGVPFLVTELCTDHSGKPFSLAVLHEKRPGGRLEASDLNLLFPQVCSALAFTHQMGMVHCDIKPANVLLQESSLGQLTAKIGDFGLASVTVSPDYVLASMWADAEDECSPTEMSAAGFSGTYDYMSPEQSVGEPLDARTDVYSLGVMLYRLATGYDRMTFLKPSEIVDGLPEWVDEVVVQAVAAEKEDRCSDALELLFCLPERLRPAGVQRSRAY